MDFYCFLYVLVFVFIFYIWIDEFVFINNRVLFWLNSICVIIFFICKLKIGNMVYFLFFLILSFFIMILLELLVEVMYCWECDYLIVIILEVFLCLYVFLIIVLFFRLWMLIDLLLWLI